MNNSFDNEWKKLEPYLTNEPEKVSVICDRAKINRWRGSFVLKRAAQLGLVSSKYVHQLDKQGYNKGYLREHFYRKEPK